MSVDAARPRFGAWVALATLSLGLFMTLLDLTIVNIAIPSLVDGIHASLDQILWVLNAYSLLYAVLLITAGRLGDVFGPRNLFITGVAIFTIASAISGLAQNPSQLIAARALQGVGAAVLAPQGLPIVLRLFAAERRAGVFAIYGILGGLAVLAGPTAGGFLVTHFGWRAIFYVNLPFGLVTMAMAFIAVPDLRQAVRHRLDIPGVLLVSAGLFAIVFGLIEGQRYDWGTITGFVTIPAVLAGGGLLVAVFLVQQWRTQGGEPLLPFAVFKDRNFTLMTVVLAAMGFAILGFYLPLTIYLQSVLGLSALEAGLIVGVEPLASLITSGVAASLSQKVSGKYLLIPGLVVLAAGIGFVDWAMQADASRWSLVPGLVISGLGMGFVWTPVYSLATRDLSPQLGGVASGVINTTLELGTVIASAVVGAVLQNRLAVALHDEAVSRSAPLPAAFRAQFVDGFSHAAKNGFEVGSGQTGSSLSLPPGVPVEVVHQLQAIAHAVFANAFVDAARPTILIPIGVLLLAALATSVVRAGTPAGELIGARTPSAAPPRKGEEMSSRLPAVPVDQVFQPPPTAAP